MKKLLKQYGFNSDMQYFEMIAESFLNGQRTQAHDQFKAMPRKERADFLKSATVGGWQSGISSNNISSLFDLLF
jgi:hypothetical protein